MDAAEAQSYLETHIPLSRGLGVHVDSVSNQQTVLSAPFAPNVNHEATVFGGSMAALAVLAGWTWLWHRLGSELPGQRIVIQRSQMEYLRPAADDFVARCDGAPADAWNRFRDGLDRKGRARITLSVGVESGGTRCAEFQGTYVVITAAPAAS